MKTVAVASYLAQSAVQQSHSGFGPPEGAFSGGPMLGHATFIAFFDISNVLNFLNFLHVVALGIRSLS